MRLTELEPQFLIRESNESWWHVDSIVGAEGIIFLCPVCFVMNKGNVGTHSIICWTPQVPLSVSPGPGRWEMLGTGYSDLTLRAGSSSIFLTSEGGCKAHFFIDNGNIRIV
jgi:hypothetical protein